MKKIRLADIAARAGVSIQHVSRALSEGGVAAPATRKKIRDLAYQLGYFDRPKTNSVAVLSGAGVEEWSILCLNALRENGRQGVIFPFQEFTIHDERYFDGAIYTVGTDDVSHIWYNTFHIPLITINNYGNSSEHIESIQPDADEEMRVAVTHLAELGHKRIARLHPTSLSCMDDKLITRGEVGFFSAAMNLGIQNFVRNENYEPESKVNEIIPRLLAESFTAFIVVADPDYRRVLNLFQQCGKRIPEDVSLIVYEMNLPPELHLTAIKLDVRHVVETGIELFLKRLAGESIPLQTIVPGKFNIRSSTGRCCP